jgi:hypothetical protein
VKRAAQYSRRVRRELALSGESWDRQISILLTLIHEDL